MGQTERTGRSIRRLDRPRGPVLCSDGPTSGSKQPWEVEQIGGVNNGRTENCMDEIIKSVHFTVLFKKEDGI